jgi:phosphoribosylglycinamide formyltransferase-1
MIRLAVFASGSGSNAEQITAHFAAGDFARVVLIVSNKADAGVIDRAHRLGVPVKVCKATEFSDPNGVEKLLGSEKIDFVVLAGFLLLVPPNLIRAFQNRIVNIHPALLPQFGGKGFYGSNVHKAVIESGSMMSGITVHHVNEKFDEGSIIFQAACHIDKSETPDSLAAKIHQLEYAYFPIVIEKCLGK